MTKAEKEKEVRSIRRTCMGPLDPEAAELKAQLLEAGDLEGARLANRVGRPGCGQDINDLIVAHLDEPGEELEEECPGCKRTVAFTVPVFDDDDRAEIRRRRLEPLKARVAD